MNGKVLVPLDGSDLALQALIPATTIARQRGWSVVLVRAAWASPTTDEYLFQALTAAKRRIQTELDVAATRARARGVEVETHVYYGDAGAAIAHAADREGANLVVMTTHGRSGLGRWVFGSVAEEVLRRVDIPILLVPAGREFALEMTDRLKILMPLDGSDVGEAAIGAAADLAAAVDAEIVLLRVAESHTSAVAIPDVYTYGLPVTAISSATGRPEIDAAEKYLNDVAARLRGASHRVVVRVETGDPRATIARVAREEDAGIVAMATHTRGELARLVLGSIAMETLRRAHAPLLVVRAHAPVEKVIKRTHLAADQAWSIDLADADLALVRRGLDRLLLSAMLEEGTPERVAALLDRLPNPESAARMTTADPVQAR
jgi:nucleotide-binding universal stress UspA family protein